MPTPFGRISNAIQHQSMQASHPTFLTIHTVLLAALLGPALLVPALLGLLMLLLALLLVLNRLLIGLIDRLASLPLLLARLDSHSQGVGLAALGRFCDRALGFGPVVCSCADFVPVYALDPILIYYVLVKGERRVKGTYLWRGSASMSAFARSRSS